MTRSSMEWHERFSRQAAWTRMLRQYLFQKIDLSQARRIIEVGCGTGAVLAEVMSATTLVYGLDINREHLLRCTQNSPSSLILQGDAYRLPFPTNSFDLVFCHFLLLWLARPEQALQEMARIAAPGAAILCLAEPDYGGRIDYPQALSQLGSWQSESLRRQGANPNTGRLLAEAFHHADLTGIQSGVLGGEWSGPVPEDDFDSEWSTLENDLLGWIDADELAGYKKLDRRASNSGSRVLFVPTFYALGRVPLT